MINIENLKSKVVSQPRDSTKPDVEVEIVEEEEFESSSDVEVDLSNALSLLEDMTAILEELNLEFTKNVAHRVNGYMQGEINRLVQEGTGFLADFQMEGVNFIEGEIIGIE